MRRRTVRFLGPQEDFDKVRGLSANSPANIPASVSVLEGDASASAVDTSVFSTSIGFTPATQ